MKFEIRRLRDDYPAFTILLRGDAGELLGESGPLCGDDLKFVDYAKEQLGIVLRGLTEGHADTITTCRMLIAEPFCSELRQLCGQRKERQTDDHPSP